MEKLIITVAPTGSVNFSSSVYANSPDLIKALAGDMKSLGIKPEIEIFDVSMIQNALDLVDQGVLEPPLHFDFVMGLKGAIPATIENLVHLKNSIPRDMTWSVAGVGRNQLSMCSHGILMGGHVRVGLEDCIYYRRGELVTNGQLVKRMADLSQTLEREIADPDEARAILGLV
jgi:3-keto-5-aminohexanoate cleavage enzyme